MTGEREKLPWDRAMSTNRRRLSTCGVGSVASPVDCIILKRVSSMLRCVILGTHLMTLMTLEVDVRYKAIKKRGFPLGAEMERNLVYIIAFRAETVNRTF